MKQRKYRVDFSLRNGSKSFYLYFQDFETFTNEDYDNFQDMLFQKKIQLGADEFTVYFQPYGWDKNKTWFEFHFQRITFL